MEGFKFDQAPKENSENNEEAISRKKAEEENLKKERLNLIRTQVAILFNTLNGLFRDLKNTEHVFDVAYLSTVPNRMLAAIPPAVNPGSFMNLALDLRNEFQALQFDIVEIPERDTRDFFIKELKILSRNLLMNLILIT